MLTWPGSLRLSWNNARASQIHAFKPFLENTRGGCRWRANKEL
jgi:hypothetical protein